MIKVYCKQQIDAEQFDGSQKYIFGHKVISDNSLVDALTHNPVYYSILINEDDSDNPEDEPNEVVFEIGDWIIKDEEIHAIDDDVFKNKYAELPVMPKRVADWIEKCKLRNKTIAAAMDQQTVPVLIRDYFRRCRNRDQLVDMQNTFARAWLDGYQVEAQHED